MHVSERWERVIARTAPSADPSGVRRRFAELDAAYRDARRAYHTWTHIGECFGRFDEFRHEAEIDLSAPLVDATEWSILYHDAIYVPGAPDNEARSADLARGALSDLDVAPDIVTLAVAQILSTAHTRASPTDVEGLAFNLIRDIDLAILGAPRERFAEYDTQIREEYAQVPRAAFREGRRRVLASFLRREHIYETRFFRTRLERGARANLGWAIDALYSKEERDYT